MKNARLSLPSLVLAGLLVAAGCNSKNPTKPAPDKPTFTTFTILQNTLFTPSCALTGCHGETSPQGPMLLTAGKAYANLVDVNSTQSPGLKRVKPFDSASSYLMKKLGGQGTSIMPPGGKLAQARIDSVAAWIDRGALNN